MDHQREFRRAALELGIPDEEISSFGRHLRVAIGLTPAGEGPAVGRLGGLPRLPVGMEWPSAGDIPLPLLLSVDCGALPGIDGSAIPDDGTLLFFVDQERDHEDTTGRYARVVYVPDGTGTAPAPPPHSVWVHDHQDVRAELRAELPLWLQESEDEDWHEYWEDLEYEDMSSFQQELFQYMERDLPHAHELRTLARDLWPGDAFLVLGGYADDEVISGIAQQTLAGREKAGEIPAIPIAQWPSLLERERHRLTSEWTALMRQGRFYEEYSTSFVIRHEDLAAARVDKALPVTGFLAP
ncbi:DUF1963 domain-containing protein [Streptomyces sp. SID11385]|uniref:DUF1963 domain-containing protein n=1 Tax=Streptomyces sp. SID11385 TaxID=2706031 RepID=UPI0013C5B25A|nr:DUF1963 domain-containing protein [Streptomyces sp. SID11385]NEA43109.1 DUF1963 domain-containing protein [Streptomyces sp. SID11385]